MKPLSSRPLSKLPPLKPLPALSSTLPRPSLVSAESIQKLEIKKNELTLKEEIETAPLSPDKPEKRFQEEEKQEKLEIQKPIFQEDKKEDAKKKFEPIPCCEPCAICCVSMGLTVPQCCLMQDNNEEIKEQKEDVSRSTGEWMDSFFHGISDCISHSEICNAMAEVCGCNCSNLGEDMRIKWLTCIYHPLIFMCWASFRSACTGIPADKERNFYNDVRRVIMRIDELNPDTRSIDLLYSSNSKASDAIMNLTIHGCDELVVDRNLYHPLVRVSIVDLTTGEYWLKSDPERLVLYQSESGSKSKFVLPAMTEPYKMKGTGSSQCIWAEDILYNEKAEVFLKPQSLMLFEILEFGSKVDIQSNPDGFRTVCWGFLKLLSCRGKPNFGRVRIQLYELAPHRPFVERPNTPNIYFEYLFQKNVERFPYPSTLHCTLALLDAVGPKPVRGFRPHNVLQIEKGKTEFSELWKNANIRYASLSDSSISNLLLQSDGKGGIVYKASDSKAGLHSLDMADARATRRIRKIGEVCLIPENYLFKVGCSQNGVSCLEFSPNGRFLAAGCGEYALFPIKVFDVKTGALLFTFLGHHNYIYDLHWSADSCFIISASSDSTVRLWDFDARLSREIKIFPHPTYVYTAHFHPKLDLVATGGFDGILRIFDSKSGEMYEAHNEHVESTNSKSSVMINNLVFSNDGDRIFSVDSRGCIRVWALLKELAKMVGHHFSEKLDLASFVSDLRIRDKQNRDSNPIFTCLKEVSHPELQGSSISSIAYSQFGGERLVVYSRDSTLFLFNAFTLNLRVKMIGASSSERNMKCVLSPDGSKVMAGSEDGKVYFWDCHSGHLDCVLEPMSKVPIHAVAWHPSQHLIACSSFGEDYPIFFYESVNDNKEMK